ncbi:MAG: PaaI family thioesterase [Lachnospiraceae bacterium]|nr:PaaI family thioesterase [Lachnospiraceae bacterium]
MNYQTFRDLATDEEYGTQEEMERVFHSVTDGTDETCWCFNECLAPKFISCSWENLELTLQYDIATWMLNPAGIVHGGIISSGCDLAMGMLTRYLKRRNDCVTVQMQMQFMRPVTGKGNFLVKAKSDKAGRNLYFMSARVYRSSDAELAALASAEFM